jgi:hypothetical protein
MYVHDKPITLLSDYELFRFLKDRQTPSDRNRNRRRNAPNNLSTIEFEALQYLSNRPCATYTDDHVLSLLRAFRNPLESISTLRDGGTTGIPKDADNQIQNGGRLTKAEKLQIVNVCPRSLIDLYPIIEEIETRFPAAEEEEEDAGIQLLLELIQAHLPVPDVPDADQDSVEDGGMEETGEQEDNGNGDVVMEDVNNGTADDFVHEGPSAAVASDKDDE